MGIELSKTEYPKHSISLRKRKEIRGKCMVKIGQNRSRLRRRMRVKTPLPVLADVERPFELQVCVFVVVHKHRDSVVMSACQHARRRFLGVDCKHKSEASPYKSRGCLSENIHFFS